MLRFFLIFFFFLFAVVVEVQSAENNIRETKDIFSFLSDSRIETRSKCELIDSLREPDQLTVSGLLKYFAAFDGDFETISKVLEYLVKNGQRKTVENICVSFLKKEIEKKKTLEPPDLEKVATLSSVIFWNNDLDKPTPDSNYNLPQQYLPMEDGRDKEQGDDTSKVGINVFKNCWYYLFLEYFECLKGTPSPLYLLYGNRTSDIMEGGTAAGYNFRNKFKNAMLNKLIPQGNYEEAILYRIADNYIIPYITEKDVGRIIEYIRPVSLQRYGFYPEINGSSKYYAILILRYVTHHKFSTYKEYVDWWDKEGKNFKISDVAVKLLKESTDPAELYIACSQLSVRWNEVNVKEISLIKEARLKEFQALTKNKELKGAIFLGLASSRGNEELGKIQNGILKFLFTVTGDKIVDE